MSDPGVYPEIFRGGLNFFLYGRKSLGRVLGFFSQKRGSPFSELKIL